MHRIDREEVFLMLVHAQARLQDVLTERLLQRILLVEKETEGAPGRKGYSGIVAELLGHLLALEKEEAYLNGVLCKESSVNHP